MDEKKEKIRAFLLSVIRTSDLQEDDDIFALGFVDSLFAMELVLFVESEFQITVEREDLDYENFKTIKTITSFVERKMA